MKEDVLTGMYYDYAMAAPLMVENKELSDMNVLILGMGTGTYATQCKKYYGDMSIEGVEIDGKITNLSRRYFALPGSVKVTTYDGRAYLNADVLAVMKANTENLASEDLKRLMNYVSLSMEDYRAGSYLMTDDKAPVELLGMRVIDSLIQEEVSYYKDIYKEQGIEGLLNNL